MKPKTPPVATHDLAEQFGRTAATDWGGRTDHRVVAGRTPLCGAEFLQRAGLPDPDPAWVEASTLIEWRGGGPEAWAHSPTGRRSATP
ncbi:hypothetical protein OG788_07990 [Streptomyces sp. NBC_00647]